MKTILLNLCLAILVAGLNSCGLLDHHAMTVYHQQVSKAPFDAVIVPGLPYDTGNLNPLLKARMLWAKELYDKGITKHIIFSGSAVHSPYIEAMIMKMMADSMGIPTQHTFIEDEAMHSNQNVAFGVKKAASMGFTNIAVATDPIQALVVKKYMRINHTFVSILPFSLKAMPVYYSTPIPNVDANKAFVKNFVPLKQRTLEESALD